MKFPAFLRKKRTYIILLLLIGGGIYASTRGAQPPTYETVKAEKGTLLQTVEVTGEIQPAARVDLAFKSAGTIASVRAKVGDKVRQGDVLASLQNDDHTFAFRSAQASLAIAQANLNARLAGETTQSIRIAETQVEQAQAAYDKAVADLTAAKITSVNAVKTAELNMQTAKHNLENQDLTVAQTVQNAYDSARTSLFAALGPLQTGLIDGDQISGVDNGAANQSYLNVLGILESGSLERAKNSYSVAKQQKLTADSAVTILSSASSKEDILAAGEKMQSAVIAMQAYLTDVQKVLAATIPSANLTATELASKKASIDGDRASISAQNSAVLAAMQAVKNTQLSSNQTIQQLEDAYTAATVALTTAKTNADVQVRTAESNVAIQKAGLDAAQATLDLRRSGPRAVDVEGLRASVNQATVAFEKAQHDLRNIQIVAPVDGTIAEVIPDVGEQVTPSAVAIRLVGTNSYDIEALVPEADIAKIELSQDATITLDAYGDDIKFTGHVSAENPDESKLQDATYYKIRVAIDPDGRDIKPGMTANVTVKTGEAKDVIIIPLRAVRTETATNNKTVRILVNGAAQERKIEVGMRGDEGRIAITSGVNEQEDVIVGETTTAKP